MSEPRPLFEKTPPSLAAGNLPHTPTPGAMPAAPLSAAVAAPLGPATDEGIAGLGRAPMERIAGAADKLMHLTKAGDLGVMGERLGDLVVAAKGLDPEALRDKGLLRKLFGGAKALAGRTALTLAMPWLDPAAGPRRLRLIEAALAGCNLVPAQARQLLEQLNEHADRLETLESATLPALRNAQEARRLARPD